MDEEAVRKIVLVWIDAPRLRPLPGAMNSETWLAECRGERYVVKVTDRSGLPGLRVAALLEAGGMPAGAPIRQTTVGGQVVALLRYVAGRPLGRGDAELVGETLGRVHRRLAEVEPPSGLDRWPWRWLDPAEIQDAELRAASTAAVAAARAAGANVTHGILHGDPGPEAFLAEGSRVGVIDWGSALYGPLVYDLASARMYAGPDVVTGYARTAPLEPAERDYVDVLGAFRWAVQAWYFSRRIANDDRTGIEDPGENEKGLADARAALVGSAS